MSSISIVVIRAGRWQKVALLGLGLVGFDGCRGSSLWTVGVPANEITEAALNSPTGAQQAFLGAEGQFTGAVYGLDPQSSGVGVVYYSELLSDEYTTPYSAVTVNGGTFYDPANDARYTSGTIFSGGATYESYGDQALSGLLWARSALLVPAPYLNNDEIDGNRSLAGEALALAGYAELLMAEDYCPGVALSQAVTGGGVQFGHPLTTDSVLGTAEAHFKQALTESYQNDTVVQLASIGLGRALLGRGRFDSAAAAVANVPTGFVYNVYGSNSTFGGTSPVPLFYYFESSNQFLFRFGGHGNTLPVIANDEGSTSYNFATSNDPRLALVALGPTADGYLDANTPGLQLPDSVYYWPLKFGSTLSAAVSFPLATGIEARMIQAEDTFHVGHYASLYPYLDSLRNHAQTSYINASGPVPILSGDTTACGGPSDTLCVKTLFRERAFWLFGLGNRLGDMRREIRQYGLDTNAVFPHGAYWYDPTDSAILANAKGGVSQQPFVSYGNAVSLTVPTAGSSTFQGDLNPYAAGGCLVGTSTATP